MVRIISRLQLGVTQGKMLSGLWCTDLWWNSLRRGLKRERRWGWKMGLLILLYFGVSTNVSWHVCSASSSFLTLVCHFSHSSAPLFFSSVLFWQVPSKNRLSSSNYARLVFYHPPQPFFFFFYYHGGFTSVRRRFGDESNEIIPIPAPPLSRSNSLTTLSDSILAPTARVNLLCHLQSTRGSNKSRTSPCQNHPTSPLFRSIDVYFLPFYLSRSLSLSLQSVYLLLFLLPSLSLRCVFCYI